MVQVLLWGLVTLVVLVVLVAAATILMMTVLTIGGLVVLVVGVSAVLRSFRDWQNNDATGRPWLDGDRQPRRLPPHVPVARSAREQPPTGAESAPDGAKTSRRPIPPPSSQGPTARRYRSGRGRSKYDSFWRPRIKELERALDLAVRGDSVFIDATPIEDFGNRQSWAGSVSVQGEEIVSGGDMAHAKSLGNVLIESGVLRRWPDVPFCLSISKDRYVRVRVERTVGALGTGGRESW